MNWQGAAKAQQALYDDIFSAWGYADEKVGNLTSQKQVAVYTAQPCKLVRKTVTVPDRDGIPRTTETYTLHTAPGIALAAGCAVTVTHLGATYTAVSSRSRTYNSHCETELEIKGVA